MKTFVSTLLILLAIGLRAQIAEIEGDLSITSDSSKVTFIELLENPTATGILYSKQGDFVIQSLNRDIDIESVRGISFQADDDINFFNEDFDVESANVRIEAEKTFSLQNDIATVLSYDSLGRVMINESRQAESDLHINQSGGFGIDQ